MAPHQIYYWKDDTKEWLKSAERATPYLDVMEAQTVKGRCPGTSGVTKDRDDERYHYVMRVGLEARDA
jgi:hypothetical protein